jgi:putative polyketide hydroxylase
MPSVLIVGGGLVGLSAALCLQYHGVDYVLVERNLRPSPLPRSRGVHARTMEIFRQVGAEPAVARAAASALKMGKFGGARMGRSLVESEALDIGRGPLGAEEPSPSSFSFCPQVLLEPVLRDLARERGGDLRFGTELSSFFQDGDRITTTLTDVRGGGTEVLHADYLIAADGASSPVRHNLDVKSTTRPPTRHYLNLYFHADLSDLVRGRTFSQCEIANEKVSGLLLAKNNTDEWSFHLAYDPERESPRDYPDERCIDLLHAAIGPAAEGREIRLLGRGAWDTGSAVVEEYRRGRIFLAGDAAHRHAPWGGFGANTGVADVHNLAWKLAAVLRGEAGDGLLDTYQPERRPRALLAADQASLRDDFLSRFGHRTPENTEAVDQHLGFAPIMTRYRYDSTAVDGARGDTAVDRLTGQVGTRVPHVWLESADGEQCSTLDLAGPGFTLLTGPDPKGGEEWRQAAEGLATVHRIGPGAALRDVDARWPAQAGLRDDGALLVRSDGFVAARSDEGLTPATLGKVLCALTR